MAKNLSVFVCQQCGYETSKWLGKCTSCGAWGSLVETVVQSSKAQKYQTSKRSTKSPVSLSQIQNKKIDRLSTTISELDRVLGGGLVPGQVVLLAGEPGIGKSTILTQIADKLGSVLYVCGEESANQVAIRAKRLEVKTDHQGFFWLLIGGHSGHESLDEYFIIKLKLAIDGEFSK